ncbi:hypothetical protein BJ508DRAFT_33147 [Ascobolus immersus RN42]|uniref:RlpA-like protein double-psi beta-barrel domain-containing protein n=1 Tax=Ascobolus immersus RN42 TaxID=1160509 RepID=A0A3N4HLI9_ASCIM|nr:hypothetical protein BJ508DRAFT_33147 [Ascobolus immersus RN42]
MSQAPADPEKALTTTPDLKKDDPSILTNVRDTAGSGSDSEDEAGKAPKRTFTIRIPIPTFAWLTTPAWATKLSDKLPTPFPGREKIAGLKRKTFFRIVGAALLVLLIIIIAVPAGLAAKKAKSKGHYIPLPTNREAHTGTATYYAPGLGACGHFHSESFPVIALGHETFDAARALYPADEMGANGGACGKKIRLYRMLRPGEGPGSWIYDEAVKGGLAGRNVSVEGVVGDRCPGCGPTDLDLGPGLFREIATESMGRVGIRWAFVD